MKTYIAIAVAVLFAATSATASQPQPREWPEEPTSILGIVMGESFANQKDLVECPKTKSGYRDRAYKGFCFENPPFYTEFQGEPALGFPYALQVMTLEGAPHVVIIKLPRAHAAAAVELLVGKYGQPTAAGTSTARNAVGGVASGMDMTWQGKKLDVDFQHTGSTLSDSIIMVTTKRWTESEAARKKTNAAKNNL